MVKGSTDGITKIRGTGVETRVVQTKLCFPVSIDKDYHTFISSFRVRGVLEPLVVVLRNKEEWDKDYAKYPNILPYPKDWDGDVYQVRCGNNRLRFHREEGMEYITVVVCENDSEVSELCKEQQKKWKRGLF